jgi:hypothetical protein
LALLGAGFTLVQWDQASRLATMVSALAAVAGIGVAVWAALPGRASALKAFHTGKATAVDGGVAVSGVKTSGSHSGELHAERTGDATAKGDGQATSGIRQDGPKH